MAFKVLLVEDDNNLREIYEARLQAEGYDIVTARDGEEALGVAKTEVPDLVISDVMMPRVSGFEMLDILRNTDALKDVKVIMLTALGQADDKTRANSLGADRYLVKSQVTLEDIVKTAHELLGDGAAEAAAAPAPSAAPAAPAPAPAATPAPVQPVAPAPVMQAPAPSPAAAPIAVPAPPVATPPTAFSPTVGASQPPVVPAPPQVAPAPIASAPVTPMPSLPPLPGAAPAVTPVAAPVPTPASTAPAAPSTSEEQATVASQINNFVQTAPDTTLAADPAGPAAQDDAVLADAMHDLAESTMPTANEGSTMQTIPQPSASPAAPAPAVDTAQAPNPLPPLSPAPATPPLTITPRPMTQPDAPKLPAEPESKPAVTGSVPIANKKIIQPLSGPETKPDIHELAAREEANGMAQAPAPGSMPPAATSFSPTVPTPPAAPAGPVVDGPDGAPQPPQAPPANPGGFDPNSISL